ncbi:PWWP domain-containing DNA repair factor 3A isoform X1 [Scleropages formosus]|uniref:PWWP domain-containing DNA repair factor 3A-like n=1 Tax=Scleropages formosus TaxID=113540 RepID=A0A8C9S628_SCLFO|nr:PWWP domain-containing DNA repair factor 3A-like isoform X1 [Scleropages formosus]XP_018601475.2 PWWP domain-containing DNA repair factor 3A-like isoform X1 [Scleropages formosus]
MMEEQLYFCKWKGRQWPAKIVKEVACNSRRKKNVEVEILGEKKRVWVQQGHILPVTKQRIEDVALQLAGQSAVEVKDPVEELKYRKVLRMVINLLHMTDEPALSTSASPRRSLRLCSSPLPASPSSAITSRVKCKDNEKASDVGKLAPCTSRKNKGLLLQDSLSKHEVVSGRLRKRDQLTQSALSAETVQNAHPVSPSSPVQPRKRTSGKMKATGESFSSESISSEHCLWPKRGPADISRSPERTKSQSDQGAKSLPKPTFTSMPNMDPHSLSPGSSNTGTSSSPKRRKKQSGPQHPTTGAQQNEEGITEECADRGDLDKLTRHDGKGLMTLRNLKAVKLPKGYEGRKTPSKTNLRKDRDSSRKMLVENAGGSSVMLSPSTRSRSKNCIMLGNSLSSLTSYDSTPCRSTPVTSKQRVKPLSKRTFTVSGIDSHSLSSSSFDLATPSSPKRTRGQSDPQCPTVATQQSDNGNTKESADGGDIDKLARCSAKDLTPPGNSKTVKLPKGVQKKKTPTKTSLKKNQDSSMEMLVDEAGVPSAKSSPSTRSKNSVMLDNSSSCLTSSDLSPCVNTLISGKRRSRSLPKPTFTSTPHAEPHDQSSTFDLGTPQRKVIRTTRKLFRSSELTKQLPSEAVPIERKGHNRGRRRKAQAVGEERSFKDEDQEQGEGLCTPCSRKCTRLKVDQKEAGSTEREHIQENGFSAQAPSHDTPQSDCQELQAGETSLSSDLSIELSLHEDTIPMMSSWLQEENEEQEEEELPSILLQEEKKPLSVKEGAYVWCKFKKFPYWPAVVKSVNRKQKKASIFFIDDMLFDQKRSKKGFSVSWKTLKPFDCEEKNKLKATAGEKYATAIKWCLDLIEDYRIRIACGSFTGTFMQYFADDISCPVRRMFLQDASDLAFPSKLIMEEHSALLDSESEACSPEKQSSLPCRRVLPDRTRAARNRANEKLVQFIVHQRGVEEHLQAIISGQVPSKWLRELMKSRREVGFYKTYLEDEEQVHQVYKYLENVYRKASRTVACLPKMNEVRLILDVLFPEAVVHAIAGVDKISLKKAEDKYLEGPLFSKRERDEFDMIIEQQTKRVTYCPAS